VGGYAFGDSALAARRLVLLAEVFEPTSRAFLAHVGAHHSGPPPELAVDLGCGTGHTTRLLVSVLGPRRVLGLDQSALRRYLELAAALLAARGHALEIGPRLHRLPDPPGLARRHDQAAPLAPPAARAAELFARNLAVWRGDAVRSGLADPAELDRLAAELAAVAAGEVEGTIAWELRQLAFRRA
jgi:SAM-dependent methyltransferase